jgi:hypothetical protein
VNAGPATGLRAQVFVHAAAFHDAGGVTPDGAREIAGRARGTPRIAGRLLRRVRDFAAAAGQTSVDRTAADRALNRLEVDNLGLDAMDRRYLMMIADIYRGGPVGIETLAAGLSEARDTLEEVIEPFLIQQGFIMRTARGRVAFFDLPTFLQMPEGRLRAAAAGIEGGRFFLAAAPEDQAAVHDGHEVVDSVWIRPVDALAEGIAGTKKLVFPTRMNLTKLARHETVAEAFAAARAKPVVTVLPELVGMTPEGRILRLPRAADYGGEEFLAGDPPSM